MNILTGRTWSRFSHICSSVISNPNGTKFNVKVFSTREKPHFFKFKENPFYHSCNKLLKNIFVFYSFFTLAVTCKHIRTLIRLSFKFLANLIEIPRVMNDFIQKMKSNSCHTYTLNQLDEQVENRYITKFKIRGSFWSLEMHWVGDCRDTKLWVKLCH